MFRRPDLERESQQPAGIRRDGAVTIVAEAAQGFEGDETLARLLVRAASASQADVVKFQLVFAGELTLPAHRHHKIFAGLEMPEEAWRRVAEDAARDRIGLAFDVFGPRSLDLALAVGADAVKIHASDVFNHPLVGAALARAPHVYFSTGGITVEELAAILDRHAPDRGRVTALVGFQAEPTATADNHLRRLGALARRFPGLRLGFMDHTDGASDEATWLAVLAVACGAVLIEKHITLDRALQIEDYVSAATPRVFQHFARRVRAAEAALGSPALEQTGPEVEYRRKALKVVVASRAIAAGATIGDADVRLIRTALDARAPLFRLEDAIGRRARRAVAGEQPLYEDDLA